MKKIFARISVLILATALYGCMSGTGSPVIKQQGWHIAYNGEEKSFNISHQIDENEPVSYPIFTAAFPEARYTLAEEKERTISSKDFGRMKYAEREFTDKVGKGRNYTFSFSQDRFGDDVSLVQEFLLYEGNSGLWTRLSIISLNGDTLKTNYS